MYTCDSREDRKGEVGWPFLVPPIPDCTMTRKVHVTIQVRTHATRRDYDHLHALHSYTLPYLSVPSCTLIPSTSTTSKPNMDPGSTCYTVVHDDLFESPTASELRNALQKGSDEVKLETMRRIIVGTLNGQTYVRCSSCRCLWMPWCGKEP
jgi:hypothetical protein